VVLRDQLFSLLILIDNGTYRRIFFEEPVSGQSGHPMAIDINVTRTGHGSPSKKEKRTGKEEDPVRSGRVR
jgi:hypothetical protein